MRVAASSSCFSTILRFWTVNLLFLLKLDVATVNAYNGKWRVLTANAGIASMHTAVNFYDSVIFLDRTNIGLSEINFTNGYCRNNPQDRVLKHDCSAHSVMLDPVSGKVRPLTIITDTWCSSGQFFANGTLVQTGGDFDGMRKVRLLDPCGPDGGCDWMESDTENLKDKRWYSTNQLLPDGRQIVVGGIESYSYEFVPKRKSREGSYELNFLNETKDAQNDNLYPFVHLLPDGNLFIFANRDAILLDYRRHKVLRKYPTIPGEPRNYPSAGSSVMLPLRHDDDFTVAEVLVCGGAHNGANSKSKGRDSPASETCGRIVATSSDDPQWVMETMPIRRVMGDMVILPTADVLIINGAQNGSQGWNKATNPAYSPVTYSPDNAKARFHVLKATTIARMYHSTANLLSDGRIIVAGSNTHQYYTFSGDFPTELRVEAFDPPYLDPSYEDIRPSIFNLTTKRIRYSLTFTAVFTVVNRTGDFELNLLSSPFTTHSFSQGQRMLKLNITEPVELGRRGMYQTTVTAPPNSIVAPESHYLLWPIQRKVAGKGVWVQIHSSDSTTDQ
uniref:Uncharacterized protein n=1 Tax=Physcomitrium patens TaxID=3218 RepID=A9U0X9_PHYPA|nr:hypothetical protein PHYPA_025641 [Physcomitrium patens]